MWGQCNVMYWWMCQLDCNFSDENGCPLSVKCVLGGPCCVINYWNLGMVVYAILLGI